MSTFTEFILQRSGSVVELPPCDRKVVSSSPARGGRVKPKTLKSVVIASSPGARHFEVRITGLSDGTL